MDEFESFLWRLSRQLMDIMRSNTVHAAEPYVEVSETKDEYVLTAETPGVNPEDIKVRVSQDYVKLTFLENGYTVYSAVYDSPELKADKAAISCKNGLLEVKVPLKKPFF